MAGKIEYFLIEDEKGCFLQRLSESFADDVFGAIRTEKPDDDIRGFGERGGRVISSIKDEREYYSILNRAYKAIEDEVREGEEKVSILKKRLELFGEFLDLD